VVIPFLILALFLTWILGDLKFLSSMRELGLGAESAQWRLIRNGGTALVWLAMLILNGLAILGPGRSPAHPRGHHRERAPRRPPRPATSHDRRNERGRLPTRT
jgi:hypothetical protein